MSVHVAERWKCKLDLLLTTRKLASPKFIAMGTIWGTQSVKKFSLHDADFGAVVLKSKKQWLHDCWRLVDAVNGAGRR